MHDFQPCNMIRAVQPTCVRGLISSLLHTPAISTCLNQLQTNHKQVCGLIHCLTLKVGDIIRACGSCFSYPNMTKRYLSQGYHPSRYGHHVYLYRKKLRLRKKKNTHRNPINSDRTTFLKAKVNGNRPNWWYRKMEVKSSTLMGCTLYIVLHSQTEL